MPDFGYAGQILKVDLSNGNITKQPSADYTRKYIGGHGLASRLYWEMVPAQAKAADPENCFICANGPVTGFPGFAGFRWKICGKTILDVPESFSYGNLGDRWGATLKYAGYDALAVQGKADKPVFLYIHDGKVEIRAAAHLMGKSTFDTMDELKAELGKGVNVLTIGRAGENQVPFSTVLAEGGASGSGGLGALMGSKNLKAIVVAGDKRPQAADPSRVRELVEIIRVNNRPSEMLPLAIPGLTRLHNCYGCGIGCYREIYPAENNRNYKALCQASMFYAPYAMRYNGGKNDGSHLLGTRVCDAYGLDSIVMQSILEFLDAGYREGFLSEKETGLPISEIGSPEFIRELTRKIALQEGFGALLARGVIPAANAIGSKARDTLHRFVATRAGEKKDYDPRLLITTALFYATEPRRPIQQLHEISMLAMMWAGMPQSNDKPGSKFSTADFRKVAEEIWSSAAAADFSTYEGKALAAKKVQDRVYAKESLVICDLHWTMTQVGRALGTAKNTVTEAQIYSAITGSNIDDAEFASMGERIFNLQRAILLRQGWAGRKDDKILDYFFTEPLKKGEFFFSDNGVLPGKNGEIISRVGAVVEKDKFEQMKTEYYGLRGWDAASGLPTKAKLEELQLKDVAADLAGRGLLK
ncbi:MAG: aldehyde ferredoxin oxidoreductase N-terminal domain-containing protein [Dehalococcoidales bacterium]